MDKKNKSADIQPECSCSQSIGEVMKETKQFRWEVSFLNNNQADLWKKFREMKESWDKMAEGWNKNFKDVYDLARLLNLECSGLTTRVRLLEHYNDNQRKSFIPTDNS